MHITDREMFNSVLTGLHLVSALHKLYPGKFQVDKVLRLLGSERALDAIKEGQLPAQVLREATLEMKAFLARRQRALIYRP